MGAEHPPKTVFNNKLPIKKFKPVCVDDRAQLLLRQWILFRAAPSSSNWKIGCVVQIEWTLLYPIHVPKEVKTAPSILSLSFGSLCSTVYRFRAFAPMQPDPSKGCTAPDSAFARGDRYGCAPSAARAGSAGQINGGCCPAVFSHGRGCWFLCLAKLQQLLRQTQGALATRTSFCTGQTPPPQRQGSRITGEQFEGKLSDLGQWGFNSGKHSNIANLLKVPHH